MLLTFSCTFYNEFAWCEESQFTILIASLKDNGILKKNSSKPKKFLNNNISQIFKIENVLYNIINFLSVLQFITFFQKLLTPLREKSSKRKATRAVMMSLITYV